MPFAYRAIAEEVEDASLVVPRCMWWSYVLNVILGILMLIVMLFGIGNLDDALNSTAPYLNLFRNAGSTGMALALSIILFLLILSGNITALATASRELWAFSRDRGFPFSQWISRVLLVCCKTNENPWHADFQILHPNLRYKTVR